MSVSKGIKFVIESKAFKNRVFTYILLNQTHVFLTDFFAEAYDTFAIETKKLVEKFRMIKLNVSLEAKFKRNFCESAESTLEEENNEEEEYEQKNNEGEEFAIFYITTNNVVIDETTDLSELYKKEITEVIVSRIDDMQENGSGWSLSEIISLTVNNNKHESFNGSSHLPTPKYILDKHAIVNVENWTDNRCFMWCILAALYPAKTNACRVSKYKKHINELNFDNITFPVTLDQIEKFEKQNNGISIHVYVYEAVYDETIDADVHVIVPVRLSKDVKNNHIHLLLLSEEVDGNNKGNAPTNTAEVKTHYCYIKNLAKLVRMQCTKSKNKIWVCDRCLHYFYKESKLNEHVINCIQQNKCKITMPEKNKFLTFENFRKKMDVPYVIYADIESLLVPINSSSEHDTEKKPKGAYQKHIAYCIGYYFHCRHDPSQSFYKSYSGDDCIKWFIEEIYRISMTAAKQVREIKPMKLSMLEEKSFDETTDCHICERKIETNEVKVRDHSHLTGKYRGAAHFDCNLKFKEPKIIPIIFHNLNYDSHFLIERLADGFKGRIDIIPINSEHYISFTKAVNNSAFNFGTGKYSNEKMRVRFIDSYRFLPTSLKKLVSYLPEDKLMITKKEWSQLSPEKLSMLCTKGVYPYDYMDCENKMNDQNLPPKEAFFNQLNNQSISDEEYQFAQSVWKDFNIKNMLEYTNLYLKTDVLLLADVFENFRDTSLKLYGLDPAHYFTTAMLSWDAMLKHTKESIELLTDIDMLMFVERGVRGGICQCSQRYCKANNKYMGDDYEL